MKSILLIAFASVLAVSAYAHCGSCGVGDAKDHGDHAADSATCPDGSKCDSSKKKDEAEKAAKSEKAHGGACCPVSGK